MNMKKLATLVSAVALSATAETRVASFFMFISKMSCSVVSYCFLLSTSTASKITTALTIIW